MALGKSSANFIGLAVLSALAAGCQNKMYDENQSLHRQNRELQAQLNDSNSRLRSAPDPSQFSSMQQQLADRDAKIAELQSNLRQPSAGQTDPGIAGIETTYDPRAGTMTVNLPGDVLFDSGKDELKSSAKATLDKVIHALKSDYAGKPLRVEGHTDADPIKHTDWEDNLELSLNRAASVTRYLQSQGVDPKLITTSGYGQYRPKGTTKAQNRRVEIVVVVK